MACASVILVVKKDFPFFVDERVGFVRKTYFKDYLVGVLWSHHLDDRIWSSSVIYINTSFRFGWASSIIGSDLVGHILSTHVEPRRGFWCFSAADTELFYWH